MSVYASAYIWEHSRHKGAELLLMLAIADIAHKNGVAFPSVKTLAGYLRMSERQVTRLIQRCEATHELEVKRNAGPHGTHLFRIRMNLTMPLFAAGDKLSGDKLSGDIQGRPGVTNRVARGDIATSPEPKELNTEQEKSARGARLLPGWQPNEQLRAWAARKRPDLDTTETIAKFKDHFAAAPGRAGVKLDWDAAFRNWVRNEKQGRPGDAPPPPVRSRVCGYCDKPAHGSVGGIWHCDAHMLDAMDDKPRLARVAA